MQRVVGRTLDIPAIDGIKNELKISNWHSDMTFFKDLGKSLLYKLGVWAIIAYILRWEVVGRHIFDAA